MVNLERFYWLSGDISYHKDGDSWWFLKGVSGDYTVFDLTTHWYIGTKVPSFLIHSQTLTQE